MADHHKGYAVPIGGVVAYEDAISPSGVGFDIACGNKAVLTDADAKDVKSNIATIMNDIWRTISFGIGRKNDDERVDHDLFDDPAWRITACKPLKEMARQQLGTVGSGNHYVDIFEDEIGRVWIGVHFGSRGLGHKTATWFLTAAGAKDGMDVEPCILPVDSHLGAEYLEGMRLGGRYAYAGRDWVCGRDLWVVRKGATPAFPGQRGFVGGSMGDISVIIEGVAHESTAATLCSTVHGAGRVMGRMEAKGKMDRKTVEVKRAGKVTPEMMHEWVSREQVELRGAGVDESPHRYKRLPEVLAEHGESIRILHTLRPLGVAMAGEGEVDPYKD
jgi:tRNA-splicing ligase RtcB (3'-phosphate/5'-hydroxy nucleic acid ligase)